MRAPADPPGFPALLFPTGLRAGERYFVFTTTHDSPTTRAVVDLLQWGSPGAVLIAVGDAPPLDATIVVFGPDGIAVARRLVDGGVAQGSLRYLPLPVGYPWAFWDTWRIFEARRDLWHCVKSFEAYRHFFVRSPYLGGEANAQIARWEALRDTALYWTEAFPLFESHAADLAEVRAGLADDRSRDTFDMVLASEPRRLWHHYIDTVFATTDYLDDDVPRPGEHVLNLGVFTGHELPYFSALLGAQGTVHCIDPAGFDLLSDYAREHLASTPTRMVEARFAASRTEGSANFRSYPDGQLCVNDTAEWDTREFPTASVDEYVRSAALSPVGFVKIDIEGMELEALAGMRETLERQRPTVSLAIYHQAEHLWEIPLRLMHDLRDYRFHISHTSPVRWETVLTAVPSERAGIGVRRRHD